MQITIDRMNYQLILIRVAFTAASAWMLASSLTRIGMGSRKGKDIFDHFGRRSTELTPKAQCLMLSDQRKNPAKDKVW